MNSKAPRGTRDMLFEDAVQLRSLEEKFRKLCHTYNFAEILTPIFEEMKLFNRGVGAESDIVTKEMYVFKDRGGRRLALRPEGTAGVVRAYIEHGLHNVAQPVKLFYCGPMFRYDRPQAGRQRQFFQVGVEYFGTVDPAADAEVIKLTADFLARMGLKKIKLHLNSVGCHVCRPVYQKALSSFAATKAALLCPDCRRRALLNPLRLLDCKEDSCRALLQDAPRIDACLCSSCRQQFQEVQELLDGLNVSYLLDPFLVRGLDYYTTTTFEFISDYLGAQGSLGGGGRYDNLVETCGGPPTPGVGMAAGVERILLAREQEGLKTDQNITSGVFLAFELPGCRENALRLLYLLREEGIRAEMDFQNRRLRAQLKYAHRKNFHYVLILEDGAKIKLRDMGEGEQREFYEADLIDFLVGKNK